jgi:hypothetical protein
VSLLLELVDYPFLFLLHFFIDLLLGLILLLYLFEGAEVFQFIQLLDEVPRHVTLLLGVVLLDLVLIVKLQRISQVLKDTEFSQ